MSTNSRRPVAPELFGRMVGIAISAGQQRAPRVQSERDPPRDPYMQAAVAVREALKEQPELFDAVMNRFTALMDLFNNQRLGEWVRTNPRNPKSQDIHPAVIHVASQFKLKANGRFPIERFMQSVVELAEQYPAWSEIET
jgi:hypothetical protein